MFLSKNNSNPISLIWLIRLLERKAPFSIWPNVGFCSFGLIPDHQRTAFHLFEANPNLIPLLRQSVELHPNQCFQLNHCCISDTNGKTNFKLEANQSGQSHVFRLRAKELKSKPGLDDYCDQNQIDCIDFAKIDIEGHELPALQGWQKTFRSSRQGYLCRNHTRKPKRYGRKTNAPLAYLESLGYSLFLCKDSEFGLFGEHPRKDRFKKDAPLLAKFNANEYRKIFQRMCLPSPKIDAPKRNKKNIHFTQQ